MRLLSVESGGREKVGDDMVVVVVVVVVIATAADAFGARCDGIEDGNEGEPGGGGVEGGGESISRDIETHWVREVTVAANEGSYGHEMTREVNGEEDAVALIREGE
jgi:hypothetical protein